MDNMRAINQTFLGFSDTMEGRSKLGAAGAKFLRDHLREEGWLRRILPTEDLDPTSQRVIPALNSDNLVVRKDLEPGSRAVALTFGASPDGTIVSTKRIDIPVITISSLMFQIREQHLLAYEAPVTRLVEENTGKDIQEMEDYEGLTFMEAGVGATNQIIMGDQATADFVANGNAATGFRGVIQRPDLVDLGNLMLESGNRKRMTKVLMNDIDFNNVLKWTVEDVGSPKQSETLVDGYKYDKILDWLIVRTVKTDVLQTGNIYGFTDPDFLGFFFTLNDVKFYIDKIANLIRWQAWEDIAVSFGNISSIVKLELYNGQSVGVPGSDPLPDEEDMYRQTNPVFDGGQPYPSVVMS